MNCAEVATVPRKVCEWSEIEADSGIYNTCKEGEEFHLTAGLDLYEFCQWCGGRIKVVALPDSAGAEHAGSDK